MGFMVKSGGLLKRHETIKHQDTMKRSRFLSRKVPPRRLRPHSSAFPSLPSSGRRRRTTTM